VGVGIPWISLDSLVRIETYQWVTGDKPRKNFSGRFCPLGHQSDGTEGRRQGYAEAQKCSSSKLSLDSDFLQAIVVRTFGEAAQSDSNSLWSKLNGLTDSTQSGQTALPTTGPLAQIAALRRRDRRRSSIAIDKFRNMAKL
jgi:hypothetical protein